MPASTTGFSDRSHVSTILERVRSHTFHLVNENAFTVDRGLNEEGIANLDDDDSIVRSLAVRDLVRAGTKAVPEIVGELRDDIVQVRYICATALGVLGAEPTVDALENVVRDDPEPLARSKAAVALG